jgi:hypothetical protein
MISSSQDLCLYTEKNARAHTHTHQTSMLWVGFEPMIPVSERAKTVHALDRSATVTGACISSVEKMQPHHSRKTRCDSRASICSSEEMQPPNSWWLRQDCTVPTFGFEEMSISNSRRMRYDSSERVSSVENMSLSNSWRMCFDSTATMGKRYNNYINTTNLYHQQSIGKELQDTK